jgi:hypothetical protein
MSNKSTSMKDGLDGLDLSVLSNGLNISATPGLNLGGEEIDSIENIIPNKIPKEIEEEDEHIETEEEEIEESEKEEEEEPVKKEVKASKKAEPEKTTDEEDTRSALKIFADIQRENGIIDFEDEEYEDSEEFIISKVTEKITKGVEAGIEEYKNSFSPEAKEIIEAMEAGMPLESLLERNNDISTYEDITDQEIEENEALQKNLVRNLMSLKGYSKETIDKKINRLDDSGLLVDEAKDSKIELLEYSKKKKEEEKQEHIRQQKENIEKVENWKKGIKEFLDKNDEVIPGFKMNNKHKEVVYNGLTKFDKDGRNDFQKAIEKDPNFNLKVAYLALALNWNFSDIEKKATTKVARGLKDALKEQDTMGGGFGGYNVTKSNANLKVIEKALKSSKQ